MNENERHAAEVRWWLAKILEQPKGTRTEYWAKRRAAIVKARGEQAAKRIEEGMRDELRTPTKARN